ncbi:hypothetical protein VXS06_06065 [Photobacterium toruni]|uniref:Uncharacterized protein n=1 Tax=Photobacterium toruni TaxID=1935446 RepID=A0ABU6L5Q0_9GAMM|nr:hypothetical protein [Photobacterium toruni]
MIPIIWWFYKKNPSIKISVCKEGSNILLTVRNHKDANVKIKHIRLVKINKFKKGLQFDHNSFFSLVDNDEYDIQSTQNDELNILLKKNSSALSFDIPFLKIVHLYDYFLPYKNCKTYNSFYLDQVVKMPRCHIAIILDSGRYKIIPLPTDFYCFYRDYIGSTLDRDIVIYCGEYPTLSLNFLSFEERLRYGDWLLGKYYLARKTYYYLL